MKNLTLKQERFVKALVEGKSQRQAYKEAYPGSEKWKPENIDSKASNLLAKDNVKTRYEELLREIHNKGLYTREDAINDLIWVKEQFKKSIEQKPTQGNGTVYVNSVKELCVLNDLYPKEEKEKDNKENEVADMLNTVIDEIKNLEKEDDEDV